MGEKELVPINTDSLDTGLLLTFLCMSAFLFLINVRLYSNRFENVRKEKQIEERNPVIRKIIDYFGPLLGFSILYVFLLGMTAMFYLVSPVFFRSLLLLILIGGLGFGLFNDMSTLREMEK
jgi:hypothetical protein